MIRRRPTLLSWGIGLVSLVGIIVVVGPAIAPYTATEVAGPPLRPPTWQHLLGTNDIGQDLFSQIIIGARATVATAIAAAAIAVLVGVAIGAASALAGGRTDLLVTRALDVFLAVPVLPLLILVGALIGPSRVGEIAIIAAVGWPRVARIIRAPTLSLRGRGFLRAARGFGAGRAYVARRHVVPALAPIVVASFVNWAAVAVGLQAGLAFLGLSDPGDVTWGSILNRATSHEGIYFGSAWLWWIVPAGLAITIAVIGLALVGVGLEGRLMPRARRLT